MLEKEVLKVASLILAETSLDGMSKDVAKRQVGLLMRKFTNGLFRDQYWAPVNAIFKALSSAQIDWTLTKSEYRKDSSGVPTSKEWLFTIDFVNKRGKLDKLYGVIVASGAGSVSDPLGVYDLVAYVS